MGLGKFFTKKCAQSYFSSLCRLSQVFDGTWKNFHKKVCPVICFFAVETILSFWWDLESFDKKVWSVTRFFAVQAITSFWWVLEKFSQKCVPNYTFLSLWRLTWVFDGTWKNFHKKVCSVISFLAVETNLSFWWDLEKFPQKSVPSHTFLRCGDYLKFLMGLGKIFTKKCAQLHVLFAVETNLGFWWDLEKFSQKKCAQSQVSSLCRLSQVFDGTLKNFHKKVYPVTRFFAVETNLSFWCHLESFDKKKCDQLHVFSLRSLTWVFDGTWKNFHKKVCPVTRFFAVETILSFWEDLESFDKKVCPVTGFFDVETILSFWGDLESFDKKVWPVTRFFAVQTISSFWWDLEKFSQKSVPSHTFLRCGD